MFTLRVPPPHILRDQAGEDGLMAAYHRALWTHWHVADRALALLLTGFAAAARPSRWQGRWNALSKADLGLVGHEGALDDYLGMADRKGLHRLLNPAAFPLRANVLKNKHLFAGRCREAGLPIPQTFAGLPAALPGWLDAIDAVIVKPNFASKGAGIVRYERGDAWSPAAHGAMAGAIARGAIVQQALATHPALAELSPGALPTFRIMTILNEQGAVEPCDVLLRLSRGTARPVDNFNAGNLVARVGEDGRLGAAFGRQVPPRACSGRGTIRRVVEGLLPALRRPLHRLRRSPSPFRGGIEPASSIVRYTAHPLTRAPIEGVIAPLVAEARMLATVAHQRLGDGFAVIGWDIGVTAQGPVLIEGNWNPGTDVLQLVSGKGIAGTRLGRLYRHHLDAVTPDRWRQAPPLSRDRR